MATFFKPCLYEFCWQFSIMKIHAIILISLFLKKKKKKKKKAVRITGQSKFNNKVVIKSADRKRNKLFFDLFIIHHQSDINLIIPTRAEKRWRAGIFIRAQTRTNQISKVQTRVTPAGTISSVMRLLSTYVGSRSQSAAERRAKFLGIFSVARLFITPLKI